MILTFLLALAHQDVTKQRTTPPAAPVRSIDNDEPSPIELMPIRREAPVTQNRPPVPPAPLAPPPLIGTPLRPATPPQSWVTPADYPATAIREGAQGVVGFRLDVDATGAVANCTVISSSGWMQLDAETCRIMRERATFKPAWDRKGKAIAAPFVSRFRWELPQPWPAAPWGVESRYLIAGGQGVITRCAFTQKDAPVGVDPCRTRGQLFDFGLMDIREDILAAVAVVQSELRVEGMPAATGITGDSAMRSVGSAEVALEIDATGAVILCRVVQAQGIFTRNPRCGPGMRFEPAPDIPLRRATLLTSVRTNARGRASPPVPMPRVNP